MKELALFMVKNLVDTPEAVTLDATEQDGATHLSLRVAEGDKGKIIGKQGKVIKALRTVLQMAALKSGGKVVLELE